MSVLAGLGVGMAAQAANSVVAPIAQTGAVSLQLQLGLNTLSRDRWNLRQQQWNSCLFPRSIDHTPNDMDIGKLIIAFNQSEWNDATEDQLWQNFQVQMRYQGVYVQTPGQDLGDIAGAFQAIQWRDYVEMTCAAAPLGSVVRDYWRSTQFPVENQPVDQEELEWNLRRAQLRRKEDRERILNPFFSWSVDDAIRLRWLGVISDDELDAILKSAGNVRATDRSYLSLLTQRVPDASTLQGWSVRQLWDEQLAARYGLDADADQSPVGRFFLRSSGLNLPQRRLPGQPEGESDWAKLGYRATRPLVGFGEAKILQHRLRPLAPGNADSIVPGVAAWTEENTRDMLKVAGFPQPIIDRLIGVVYEPINIRLINHILGPFAHHPEVRAAAAQAFGAGVDWVEQAMLDHGFSPAYAHVAAVGVHAQAEDRDQAERIEEEKKIRTQAREVSAKRYEVGELTLDAYITDTQDEFFNASMAADRAATIDREVHLRVTEKKISALRTEWMEGKLSAQEIAVYLADVVPNKERQASYLEEWTWERTSKTRMLTTGEILQTLKSGLLSPQAALVRLVNLGWSQPDALIEIAQIEHELQIANARMASSRAAKEAAQADKLHREAIREAKVEANRLAKEERENVKVQSQVNNASHEKLLATAEYYAKIHSANSAYAAAEKKGDEEKKQALLAKQLADYQKYLLDQLKLVQQGPEVEAVIEPIDTIQAAGPAQAQGT